MQYLLTLFDISEKTGRRAVGSAWPTIHPQSISSSWAVTTATLWYEKLVLVTYVERNIKKKIKWLIYDLNKNSGKL